MNTMQEAPMPQQRLIAVSRDQIPDLVSEDDERAPWSTRTCAAAGNSIENAPDVLMDSMP